MVINIDNVVSGIDIYGKEVIGKVIGTTLGHVIVKYGEDRLDTTTINFNNIINIENQ